MNIHGTTDNDDLDGTADNDVFHMGGGGNDTVHGLGGNDNFYFGSTLDRHDRVYGGTGQDFVLLNGGGDVHIGKNFDGIDGVYLDNHDYSITFDDNPGAVGGIGVIAGPGTHSVQVDASAESHLHFQFIGGLGDDVFAGGQRADFFLGGGGSDTFIPGAGRDGFSYGSVSDSTGLNFDVIKGFSVQHDLFLLPVVDVDAPVIGGTLDSSHPGFFNNTLAAAVGTDQLIANDAVIFQPDAGRVTHFLSSMKTAKPVTRAMRTS